MTLVSLRTTATADDVFDTLSGLSPGYVETGDIDIGFISPRAIYDGFRFLSVNISGDCDDAIITFVDHNFGAGGQVNTDIFCEDTGGSPSTYSSGDSPPDRTATTASVAWDYTPPSNDVFNTSDFASVVQEIIDSYTTLTHLSVFVINDDTGLFHDVESFDSVPGEAPLLTLNFTAAAAADHRHLLLMGVG